jgi:peroxiredoxin
MALTASKMIELRIKVPDFTLADEVSGDLVNFNTVKGEKGTLVMFISNHCPLVIHVQHKLAEIAHQFFKLEIGFVAISSKDAQNYPADIPQNLKKQERIHDFHFQYLYEESQKVVKDFGAVWTPEFFSMIPIALVSIGGDWTNQTLQMAFR